MPCIDGGKPDSGFALVAVLCWALLLSLCVGAVVRLSKSQADDVQSGAEIAQLRGAADSAINMTLIALTSSNSPAQRPVDGAPFTVAVDDMDVFVTINDESGKVDLNYAPRPTLIAALKAVGLSLDSAESGVDKILDWREAGSLKRLNGAKHDDYERLGYSYGPRQGAFRSVGELQLVMGFNDDLLARLEPMLTVFSQDSEVDVTSASPILLAALQPGNNLAGFALHDTRAQIPAAVSKRLLGRALTIRARAHFRGYSIIRNAVVRLSGNIRRPIWVYRWD